MIGRSSLRQREMCSVVVIVANVLAHQAFHVPLIRNNQMVEQVSTSVTNPMLCNPILPRASETDPFRLDLQGLDGTDDLFIEVRGAIENQIPWGGIASKRFPQLLYNLDTVWMAGGFPVQNSPSVMRNDK